MRVTIIEMDGSRSHVKFGATSPTPTMDWNLDYWRRVGWMMTEEGFALTWQAVARVIPEKEAAP